MLSWLKRKNESETLNLLRELHQKMDFRFSEISAQIKELELGLNQMETRLLTKDLKDKQAYGLLHYKLHEVKSNKLNEEIETLEKALSSKKLPLKDH
jgi:DNA-binding HxlR family transcriptional regulator